MTRDPEHPSIGKTFTYNKERYEVVKWHYNGQCDARLIGQAVPGTFGFKVRDIVWDDILI